ncbi:hypothetical protein, partial [Neisseria dentiae]|uniref:hypothetical protein n=1 Tax=Neisseria dentiae TaxID=194197 RepID=UPI0035A01CE3
IYKVAGYEESHIRLLFAKVSGRLKYFSDGLYLLEQITSYSGLTRVSFWIERNRDTRVKPEYDGASVSRLFPHFPANAYRRFIGR